MNKTLKKQKAIKVKPRHKTWLPNLSDESVIDVIWTYKKQCKKWLVSSRPRFLLPMRFLINASVLMLRT